MTMFFSTAVSDNTVKKSFENSVNYMMYFLENFKSHIKISVIAKAKLELVPPK